MQIRLEINGNARTVTVQGERGNDRAFKVTVDGRVHQVDLARIDPTTYSLVFLDREAALKGCATSHFGGGASHEVAIVENADGLTVHLRDAVVPVQVLRGAFGRPGPDRGHDAGARSIAAPMPGKVVKVLVKPGDLVSARQGIVVVEAMKMENELRAPQAGRVADVQVREGQLVEAGRVLVVIE